MIYRFLFLFFVLIMLSGCGGPNKGGVAFGSKVFGKSTGRKTLPIPIRANKTSQAWPAQPMAPEKLPDEPLSGLGNHRKRRDEDYYL